MKLRLTVLAASVLLAACGGAPQPDGTADAGPAARGNVLHVYNWSDYIAEDTLANFQAETGIRVVYDVYDSNEMLEAKLMARNSGYDLVFPTARPFAQRHIVTGIYQPLQRDRLANWEQLDPRVLAGLDDVDPGNRHLVPYMWGTTGLGINVARVREALGEDAALDSWSLLFDPANAERLAGCGIAVLDDPQEGFGAALIHLGRDPNSHDEGDTAAVQQAFADIRPHIRYFHSSKYIDDLADGGICLALGYSGDVLQARDRAEEAENDVEIAYLLPREGALRWIDVMAIPSDARHVDNAHRFIDFLLRPDVIAGISNYVAYANPNLGAHALLDEHVAGDPGIYPAEEVMAKLVDPKAIDDAAQRERVRAWTAIKAGR